jgi:hypothetical protein
MDASKSNHERICRISSTTGTNELRMRLQHLSGRPLYVGGQWQEEF